MSEPLQLRPDPEVPMEQLRLGDQVIEVDRETANAVRSQYETLAAQYGASLQQQIEAAREEGRRLALQQIGTPNWQPPQDDGLNLPDPDLLFSDKAKWNDSFQNSLEAKLAALKGETSGQLEKVVSAFQQELNRRDQVAALRQQHDKAMEQMLEARGLTEHTRIVQAIYNEQFENLKHLPLELGLDKIGQMAVEEIERIRAGEKWTMRPVQGESGVTSRPPAVLRTTKRAHTPAPAAPEMPQGGYQPNGDLGLMGKIIRKRQAAVLGSAA